MSKLSLFQECNVCLIFQDRSISLETEQSFHKIEYPIIIKSVSKPGKTLMIVIIITDSQILKPLLLRMGIRMSAVTTFIQYTLAILASAIWQGKKWEYRYGKVTF